MAVDNEADVDVWVPDMASKEGGGEPYDRGTPLFRSSAGLCEPLLVLVLGILLLLFDINR